MSTRGGTAAPRPGPALRTNGLGKRYGAHRALAGVSLDVMPGEVHVLFGENGAGKSTLITMLAGASQPSEGSIEVGGQARQFANVAKARAAGVRAVFQEFTLVPQLSVAENIVLGEEPVRARMPLGWLDKAQAAQDATRLLAELGFDLDPRARVDTLPRGKQQMVEICKAVRRPPRVLILDEPTASLSERDAQALFALVRRLQQQGTAIVYITHRMHEIAALGARVSVLRDGQLMGTVGADTAAGRLIEMMTGRTVQHIYPEPRPDLATPAGPVRLALHGVALSARDGSRAVHPVSLQLRSGEILGIAGLVGCGKSELAQACFGLQRLAAGHIEVDGRRVHIGHPQDAITSGLWYSPSDRKRDGLLLDHSAHDNIVLSGLRSGPLRGRWLRPMRERAGVHAAAGQVQFDARRAGEAAARFSGGNQQKVLLAKGLVQPAAVYLFDEPTVGVDVGARLAIYQCLAQLSAAGAAIVLVSSDLAELMGMAHRIRVMNAGRLGPAIERADFDEQRLLERFF